MIPWIALSLGSAFFAGLVAIFCKLGIANISSNLATAIRTIVVVVLAWIVVFITGAMREVSTITTPTLIILVLSGIATGASWLFGFWISPEYRGRGIFRQMIDFLDKWSIDRGYLIHGLGAWSDNQVAINAYTAVGFQPDGEPRPSTSAPEKFYIPMYQGLTISE